MARKKVVDPFLSFEQDLAAARGAKPRVSKGQVREALDVRRKSKKPVVQTGATARSGYDPLSDRLLRAIGRGTGNAQLERNLRAADENLIGIGEAEQSAFNLGRGEGGGWDAANIALALPMAGLVDKPISLAAKAVGRAGKPLAAKVGNSAAARYLTEARPLLDEATDTVEGAFSVRPEYIREEMGPYLSVRRKDVAPKRVPAAAKAKGIGDLRAIMRDPETNPALAVANEASLAARGRPFSLDEALPETSLARQAGIGRAYREAVEGSPAYKSAVFERYGETMPQVVEQAKAQNYDQLVEAAYRSLGDEVTQQFDRLPVGTRYHYGEGEYPTPSAMFRDVLGEGNLNVYRGGDPHEFLSEIDPATGLSLNEEFRAVHDLIGHAATGSTFRPGGEEIAYAAHARTLSPLSQLALLAETRGQNSFVNYSPVNADIIGESRMLRNRAKEREIADKWLADPLNANSRWFDDARRAAQDLPQVADINARLRELGAQTQYAPQRSVLLPPEYLDPMSPGGMPDWLRERLAVRNTADNVRGVHFSKSPELTATDPSYYGRGAFSGERAMVKREGLPNRTYFYSGPEGAVNPEQPVGAVAPYAYEGALNGLYDFTADPEGLVKLAKAYSQSDYKPILPEGLEYMGIPRPQSMLPDMERLVRDYGYRGYLGDRPGGDQRWAAVFDPVTGLRRIEKGERGYAVGGRV